ncbi:alpha/beta hydrolase-fold protein [Paenibacillus sp. FSL K6-3182]|uniref:alpha/beta hydrolase n=1 Tax=unclassified Paenibacillus TaxID=185978 RepID=UPI0030D1DD5B
MENSAQSKLIVLPGVHASRLGNERDIYIYLPVGYDDDPSVRYPVLYMHVGQHVFEPSKPSGESWGMHRVADRLLAEGLIRPIIIVAVEHKYEDGTSEYFHDLCAYPIRCVGELYEHFLIEELKPIVDRAFRTLPDADHTALMGSSAAGIATYNIGLRRPDVFGMLGILSPFFVQVDPGTLEETPQYRLYPYNDGQKIWMDIGGAEGFFMPSHVRSVAENMQQAGWKQGEELYYYLDMEAAHSEWDWSRRAHMPLLHFFGEAADVSVLALEGDGIVGVDGPLVVVNAVAALHNGIRFSLLRADYQTDNPDVLGISPDGRLLPRKPGTATIVCRYGGQEAARMYTVVERLSETVVVELEILVPDTTPEDAEIYATFGVPKLGKGLYGGTVSLPRGLTFDFLITRGYDKEEVDRDFGRMPYRRLVTDEDKRVVYTVHNWIDIRPDMGREEEI